MKKILVCLFIMFLLFGFTFTVFTKDKSVSEMENKILAPKPSLSMKTVMNKDFMTGIEKYVTDQFPLRFDFVKLKNNIDYVLGKREFKNIYSCKNGRLVEKAVIDEEVLVSNIEKINYIASESGLNSKLIVIPMAIDFYKNELPDYAIQKSYKGSVSLILDKCRINVYYPYKVLNEHKDEYIYFNTDHHWTQLGAKYVYEEIYNKSIKEEARKVSSDFYGTYYSKAPIFKTDSDDIYAYEEYSNARMVYDYIEESNKLYNNKMLEGKNKYRYFLNGDPAIGTIEGRGVGEVLVIKDSYAHNFIPFMINDYSKIHVIDARYCNIGIGNYLDSNPGIKELIFFNNVSTLSNTEIYKNVVYRK